MMKWFGTVLFCLMVVGVSAQPKKEVRTGNQLYQEGKYKEASESYQQALSKQPNYTPGLFNLGNAKYQQKDFEGARKLMDATAKVAEAKEEKAAANYNKGNTYLEEKKYKEAVEAYKEALRKNPQDENAKYNLSYALQMMKNQQGGGGNDDKKKDDKNKQDKNQQDKQNEDKKDDEKKQDEQKQNENKQEQQDDQQQQQQKKEDKSDQQDGKPQPQPSKLSEQQAEQLLNALQQEEKKLQDKLKKGKGVPIKVEKDW
ncbi:MAG: tetratricopeptide repeat protein [Chitinophagales bacterium]|nr:tetratricopeptide repeat protein [Chitinophagaceae bacterium]MCB9065348.1 tetratricopeptide repeat protein [Chitinophagales bacterium]